MNAPYTPPGRIAARLTRQFARFAARAPLRIDLDHAIVTFTFDDFPKTAATTGAAALEKRGWRGTYYASAGFAGGMTHHGLMFDPGDLQRLHAAGHEIACHTYDHLDCARARTEDVLASVERNARALEAMGYDGPLDTFAFPYGEARPAIKRLLGDQFASLRGVRAAVNRGEADRQLLSSVPIDGGPDGIQRAIEAAESLVQHPGWLIFYAHDIQKEPTEWGCRPEDLEAVCAAVQQSGAEVLTMRDALERLDASA